MGVAVRADERPRAEDVRTRRRTLRPLRAAALVLLALTLLAIGAAALALPRVLDVRGNLEEGQQQLDAGKDHLRHGETGAALSAYRRAEDAFTSAGSSVSGGGLAVLARLPILGRTVDALASISAAGRDTSRAGETIAEAVDRIGGLSGLAPARGRVPLDGFPTLAAAAAHAHELVSDALGEIRSSPSSLLIGPVESARSHAEGELGPVDRTLAVAAPLLQGLPAFLGGDGPRTYLFGAASLAELRGSGGLIGAYALVEADRGALTFSRFRPVASLPLLSPSDVPAPNPGYARNWNEMRSGNGFWLNVNMTPDFPSAALAFERAFEQATGRRVDGVIVADPFVLQALLKTTGPTTVEPLGRTIRADDVVPYLANEAYTAFPSSTTRKRILGQVAASIVQRFFASTPTAETIRDLAISASEAHLQIYSDDPAFESTLAGTGAGGAFRPVGGDLLSVVQNNASATKFDFYEDRTVGVDVRLGADGAADARVDVRLANHAPTSGLPTDMLLPDVPNPRPGENVALLDVYCGACSLRTASLDGKAFTPDTGTEVGQRFFRSYQRIPSGTTSDVSYGVRLARAWSGQGTGGDYRLTFLNQETIRPTELTIRIHAPDGMHITSASEGMTVEGDTATWTGTPTRTLALDVLFAPPWPLRWWRAFVGLF